MLNIINLEEFRKNIISRANSTNILNSITFSLVFSEEVLKYLNSEIINNLIQEKDKNNIKIEFDDFPKSVHLKSILIIKGRDEKVLLIIDAYGYESEIINGYDYGNNITSIKYFYDSLIENRLEIKYSYIEKNKLCFYRNTIAEMDDIKKAQTLFHKIYYNTKKHMRYAGNEKYAGRKLEINNIYLLDNVPKVFTDLFCIPTGIFKDRIEFESFANEILASENKESRNLILHKFYNEHLMDVGFKSPNELSIVLDNISKVKNIRKGFKMTHAFCPYSPHQQVKADFVYIKIHVKVQCKNKGKIHWWNNFFSFKLNFNDKIENIFDKPLHLFYPNFNELDGVTVDDYFKNRNEVHTLVDMLYY